MSGENLEFKWGKKRNKGGKNKEVQFYASFTFDGVEYELSDCVFMWKDGEPEPFVGKIVKIWEDKSKKVKVLWFFKPSEISHYLADVQVNENELFLASGEGKGLANVNPLEAIAGKCNVVCISKDVRNQQPTKEELEGAEYVFYRVFDVGQLKVSETIPEFPGVDIKLIFNKREGQQSNVLITNGTELLPNNGVNVNQNQNGDRHNSAEPSEENRNAEQKVNTPKNSHLPDRDNSDELNNRPFKKPKMDSSVNLRKEKDSNDQKLNAQSDGIPSRKSVGDKKSNMPQNVGDGLVPNNLKMETHVSDGIPSRKSAGDKKSYMPQNVSNDLVHNDSKMDTHVSDGQIKGEPKVVKDSNGMDAAPPVGRKLDEEVRRGCNGKMMNASNQTLNRQNNPSSHVRDVTQKPDADRKRWFKELPWEQRMEDAHRQGTLVLLENLDPSYASSEVEDIIWHGFKESCTAKVVYCATNRSSFSGQAFVIFKTKEVAEKVVNKLEHECLMLSNGRPLIASFRIPCIPGKETLIGHFGIDKLAVQLSREKKEAVSTSHCSQANTIEYEFAMDWCLLQERFKLGWRSLKEQHNKDLKKTMAELKKKTT